MILIDVNPVILFFMAELESKKGEETEQQTG